MPLTEKYGSGMGHVHDHLVAGPGEEGSHYYLHKHPYYSPSEIIERAARGKEMSIANVMREATPERIGSEEAIPRMMRPSAATQTRIWFATESVYARLAHS